MVRSAPLLALLALLTGPVLAEDWPPVMDSVTLTLSAERWVETDRPRIVVSVNAAGSGADAGAIRSQMLAALDDLAEDADWRFTSFNRGTDRSGLEQWSAQIEARLPETALDGLAEAAREASRPGLQIRLVDTDFTPTLAEVETARAALRAEIYGRAMDELERLNAAVAGRDFRIAGIGFGGMRAPMPQSQRMMRTMDMAESASAPAISVENTLTETAVVTLSALAPRPDAD